jgi:hypothetical protein
MRIAPFDVFKVESNGRLHWLAAVQGLETAKRRVQILSGKVQKTKASTLVVWIGSQKNGQGHSRLVIT